MILSSRHTEEGKEKTVKGGGVIIIGPIPILLATDKESARLAFYLTIIALIFFTIILLVFKFV